MALRNYLYAKHSHDIITETRINKAESKMEDFEDFGLGKQKKCLNCANCKSSSTKKESKPARVAVEIDASAMAKLTINEGKGRDI